MTNKGQKSHTARQRNGFGRRIREVIFAFSIAGILVISFSWASGCQEPNYRIEVRPNGEGGVVTSRVPKPDAPPPAPRIVRQPALESPVADSPMTAPTTDAGREQRIADLEARVRTMQAEIARLKAAPATTAP